MDGDKQEMRYMREEVRDKYAEAARGREGQSEGAGCCGGPSSCCGSGADGLKTGLIREGDYSAAEIGELPRDTAEASLGCGNPVALASLSPGEVVLDLGSGGGLDVLLSAGRVSPGGKAYGVDMTDEMLSKARQNREKAGVRNVEFLKGEIEDLPLPEDHVDVVISNCVINLSTDKEQALSEAFRVLKPGGRFAVFDVVFLGRKRDLPAGVLRKVELWTGCVAGALEKAEYESLLRQAGFESVSVEVTHTYEPESVEGLDTADERESLRRVPAASAFVRATKPEDTEGR